MTEAIVLVGGLGTRLRPLTLHTPKPLLPVAGVPLVVHQIARAREAGVSRVVLATSFRAELFEDTLGDGSALGIEVRYMMEDQPLGTGGAIRNAGACLDSGPEEPVLVFNGDVLDGHSIPGQLKTHERAGAEVTLYLTEVRDPRAYGCVPTDAQGRVTAFLEKMSDPVTNRINAGCYVFRRRVIDEIPAGRPVSVEREVFPALLEAGRPVHSHTEHAYWLDMGTPAAYVRGSADVVLGRVEAPARPGPAGESLLLDGAQVGADAWLHGGTTVGRGAVVAAEAEVEGSVILDGASIGPGATVRDAVVGAGATVGAGCVLEGAVVGDHARVGARNELLHGLRLWSGTMLPDGAVRFSSDV